MKRWIFSQSLSLSLSVCVCVGGYLVQYFKTYNLWFVLPNTCNHLQFLSKGVRFSYISASCFIAIINTCMSCIQYALYRLYIEIVSLHIINNNNIRKVRQDCPTNILLVLTELCKLRHAPENVSILHYKWKHLRRVSDKTNLLILTQYNNIFSFRYIKKFIEKSFVIILSASKYVYTLF